MSSQNSQEGSKHKGKGLASDYQNGRSGLNPASQPWVPPNAAEGPSPATLHDLEERYFAAMRDKTQTAQVQQRPAIYQVQQPPNGYYIGVDGKLTLDTGDLGGLNRRDNNNNNDDPAFSGHANHRGLTAVSIVPGAENCVPAHQPTRLQGLGTPQSFPPAMNVYPGAYGTLGNAASTNPYVQLPVRSDTGAQLHHVQPGLATQTHASTLSSSEVQDHLHGERSNPVSRPRAFVPQQPVVMPIPGSAMSTDHVGVPGMGHAPNQPPAPVVTFPPALPFNPVMTYPGGIMQHVEIPESAGLPFSGKCAMGINARDVPMALAGGFPIPFPVHALPGRDAETQQPRRQYDPHETPTPKRAQLAQSVLEHDNRPSPETQSSATTPTKSASRNPLQLIPYAQQSGAVASTQETTAPSRGPFFDEKLPHTDIGPAKHPWRLMYKGQSYHLPLASVRPEPPTWTVLSQRSERLKQLTDTMTGLPPKGMALDPDFFPFMPTSDLGGRPQYSVIKLRNIPFSAKRSEIIAFLGRNAKILNDQEEPIHIIMERVSSKTNDAYVEFADIEEASKAVERHQSSGEKGRIGRIGERAIEMEMSSQAALMSDLFPNAKDVIWQGNEPQVLRPQDDQKYGCFQGFVSEEEMTMLLRHVEVPSRSPYSKECPQRPFENLISTLKKLPWHYPQWITVRQRQSVYRATVELLRLLRQFVAEDRDRINLSSGLLKRVVRAAITCPGFSVVQKDSIAFEVGMQEMEARSFGQPRFASGWVHLLALGPKPGIPLDVIEWYVAIIREETELMQSGLPPDVRNDIKKQAEHTDSYFGYLWVELWRPFGKYYDNMTLAEAASRELWAIERVLSRAL